MVTGFKSTEHEETTKNEGRNAKNFACAICDERYSKFNELRRHKRIHEEKQLNCSKCDKRFARPNDVKNHERNVHSVVQTNVNEKKCSQCGEKSDDERGMTKAANSNFLN